MGCHRLLRLLGCLGNKPLIATNLGVSAFCLSEHQASEPLGNLVLVFIYSFSYLVHSFVFVTVSCVFPPYGRRSAMFSAVF